jgi:hypothetical protein
MTFQVALFINHLFLVIVAYCNVSSYSRAVQDEAYDMSMRKIHKLKYHCKYVYNGSTMRSGT